MQSLKRYGVVEFGELLLRLGDLDPIYIILHYSNFSVSQKKRWCVAYWLFYDAGISSYVSERVGVDFWHFLIQALAKLPRGTERRHFRGQKALNALEILKVKYPQPESFVNYIETGVSGVLGRNEKGKPRVRVPLDFKKVIERAKEHPQFGPWIAFKVCDMLERVLSVPVDFSSCDLLAFYKEPAVGAKLAAEALKLPNEKAAFDFLMEEFQKHQAPPGFDRPCGVTEVETILCKWKAHKNGHYPLGKDTQEIYHSLQSWNCDSTYQLRCIMENCWELNKKSLI